MTVFNGVYYLCEDGIEKSMSRDANRWSSGRIFLSQPHTYDEF